MKIYPASKTVHLDHWRALRAAGLDIRAGWLDAEFNTTGEEPNSAHWADHWAMCIPALRRSFGLPSCNDFSVKSRQKVVSLRDIFSRCGFELASLTILV